VILGNGKLTLLYDQNYSIRDVYYPYKGMYNHSLQGRFKTGLWHDGKFVWIDDLQKEISVEGLSSRVTLKWDGLQVTINDLVDFSLNAMIRKVKAEGPGLVRFIFYHDLRLNGNLVGDTAFYDPFEDVMIHYKESTYFLMGASRKLYEYTTGSVTRELCSWTVKMEVCPRIRSLKVLWTQPFLWLTQTFTTGSWLGAPEGR